MRKNTTQPVDLDELAQLLAPKVANLVLARLSSALGAVEAPYSTRKGCGPSGWSDERWKAVAASIPGSYRPKGARWTIVPRAAFDVWVASRSTAGQAVPPAPPANANARPWTRADAAAAMGWRGAGNRQSG